MMTGRLERMALKVAFCVLAKDRPDDLFGQAFFDLRLKAKELKEKWSQEAKESLQKALLDDLTDKGYKGVTAELSLGKYKGSHFVTSARVNVNVGTEDKAKKLAGYLQRFSPKFVLKDFSDGVASYNIR